MNINEEDFQKRLDEIGKLYEDGKDAIRNMTYSFDPTRYPSIYNESDKALIALIELRDIAAVAVKQAYQLKEN